jgi:hypothetical protein
MVTTTRLCTRTVVKYFFNRLLNALSRVSFDFSPLNALSRVSFDFSPHQGFFLPEKGRFFCLEEF